MSNSHLWPYSPGCSTRSVNLKRSEATWMHTDSSNTIPTVSCATGLAMFIKSLWIFAVRSSICSRTCKMSQPKCRRWTPSWNSNLRCSDNSCVHVAARIPFMRRNPDHPDVRRTQSCIQLFKDTWPISVQTSIIKEDVGWRGKENNFRDMSASTSYDKGFRVQFQHWSTILLSRYAAISKDWYNSTGAFGDQLIRIQLRNPRSRSLVDEITIHDNDNEYHVVTGCEILLTFACDASEASITSDNYVLINICASDIQHNLMQAAAVVKLVRACQRCQQTCITFESFPTFSFVPE